MKLEEVSFKLISEIQSLPPELALEFCQKALKEIQKEHNWSWSYARGFIKTPALINVGTVNVTQFSDEVIVSAALKTVLDAINPFDVPIEGRQFRTFAGQVAGSNFIYTIRAYDSDTSTLVIDPYYMDADNSVAQYQIFKSYYTAPNLVEKTVNPDDPLDEIITFDGIDFASFEFIYAPFAQRKLGLGMNRSELDFRDSARITQGDPYHVVGFGQDSSGNQLFEFYPVPNQARVYQVLYKKEGRTLEPDENIPPINYELILAKAKIKAYEWLVVNADKVGDKRSPNVFMNMIALVSNPSSENSYARLLQQAKVKDENLYPQALINMGDVPYYQEVIVETVLLDF